MDGTWPKQVPQQAPLPVTWPWKDYQDYLDDVNAQTETAWPQHPPQQASTQQPCLWQAYSNDVNVYHDRFAELYQAYNNGFRAMCKLGCTDLLSKPNLPDYTRAETLLLLSVLLEPADAEAYLEEAERVVGRMDISTPEVRLLRLGVMKMKAELKAVRGILGMVVQYMHPRRQGGAVN